MKDLSLNLLDIAENSVRAGATCIQLKISESEKDDKILLEVSDNGCGMSPEFVANVTDPFTTTRTTRKVGLGLPFLKMEAEQTGGGLEITSTLGKGTCTRAWFVRSHIDTPPLGEINESVLTLIQGNPKINFIYQHSTDSGEFLLDTAELSQELGDISLDEPEILAWIRDYMDENQPE